MKKHVISLVCCGIVVTQSFAGVVHEINLSKQCSSVTFQLPSNPSTGYSWKIIDYNQARFKEEKANYVPPAQKIIGAGGNMRFHFKPIRKHDTSIDAVFLLSYRQAWNKQSYKNTVVIVKFVDKPCTM